MLAGGGKTDAFCLFGWEVPAGKFRKERRVLPESLRNSLCLFTGRSLQELLILSLPAPGWGELAASMQDAWKIGIFPLLCKGKVVLIFTLLLLLWWGRRCEECLHSDSHGGLMSGSIRNQMLTPAVIPMMSMGNGL